MIDFPRMSFASFVKGLPLSGFEVLLHKRSPWPRRRRRNAPLQCALCFSFMRRLRPGETSVRCPRCRSVWEAGETTRDTPTLERNYCEACGYTESHDPNCPGVPADRRKP